MSHHGLVHFETGIYKRNTTFLDDQEYSRALDCFVKGCADVLLQDQSTGEILLAHRIVHPQPDWWFIGGRMRAGDAPQAAAAKNVRRETGLDLAPSRFVSLCTTSMLWQKRKQEPADQGTADIAVAFLAQITPAERATIRWDRQEYDEVKWVAPEAVARDTAYHPALRRAATHLMVLREYEALDAAIRTGADDAAVVSAARAFVTKQHAAQELGNVPVPFVDVVESQGNGAAR